jgi:hypothetical protein
VHKKEKNSDDPEIDISKVLRRNSDSDKENSVYQQVSGDSLDRWEQFLDITKVL